MKGKFFAGVLLAGCLAAPVTAAEVISNQQVVEMVRLGLDAGVVNAKITASRTDFDTSPKALAALKDAGVPPQIIQNMILAGSSVGPAAASSPAAQEVAVLAADGAETPIVPVRVDVEISRRKMWIPVAGAFMNPETFMTISGEHAPLRTGTMPTFTTTVDPLNVRLLHMGDNEEGGRYVVFDGTKSDREVALVSEAIGGGRYRLTPEVALQPGEEYAFMVTPSLPAGMGFWGWYTTPGNTGRAFDFGVE